MQPDNPLCPFGVRVAFALGLPCKGMMHSKFVRPHVNEPFEGAAEMIHKVITRDCFNNNWSKDNIIRSYIKYCEEVRQFCLPEKLLVFRVTDGWSPICKFLNKPVRYNL